MKVIAHRGACTEALENSWDAFNRAIESGADRIELDVHLTNTGEFIVMHDEDLQRTAGSASKSSEANPEFVKKNNLRLLNGEEIPFLTDVLRSLLDKIEINVELKSESILSAQKLGDLIRSLHLKHKIIISSFSISICEYLARNFSDLKIALLWEKKIFWPKNPLFGAFSTLEKNNISIFHPDARLITPNIISLAKERGIQVFPYISLSKETEAEKLWTYLMTLGVDGLCTNYPRQMKLWVQEALEDVRRFRS